MNTSFASVIPSDHAVFFCCSEKTKSLSDFSGFLDDEKLQSLNMKIKKNHFSGAKDEILEFDSHRERSFLWGLGDTKKTSEIRNAFARLIRFAQSKKHTKIVFVLPSHIDMTRALSGVVLGQYTFKIGDNSEQIPVESVVFVSSQSFNLSDLESEKILAEATNRVRDLVNLPPNYISPSTFVDKAKTFATVYPHIHLKVIEAPEIQSLKMNALYAVGKGSIDAPAVVIFEYFGAKDSKEKPLAFVGKGVTFDSGGYNLKPTSHIESMKCDMAGGATVFGLFDWIAQTKPSQNIVGVVGLVENLVSYNAYKPGDVLTAFNGKTIEITNTDAEGRLVLADCLSYVQKMYNPQCIVDLATLTGAVIAALGNHITGIMGNHKNLLNLIQKASQKREEDCWELPLNDFFLEKTKGTVSDLQNWTAGVNAGSSMAAAFLQNFVEKETPWVHCDIAGTAFYDKSGDDVTPKGATGAFMRTLTTFIQDYKASDIRR